MDRSAGMLLLTCLFSAACVTAGPVASPSLEPQLSPSLLPTETPLVTAEPTAPATPEPTPTAVPATPTSQPTPRPPRILTFIAPEFVDCSVDPEPFQIHLEWEIVRGTGVTISIDGPGVYDTYDGTTGAADVPFSCSEDENTYLLTTVGGVGEPDTELRTVRRTQPG